MKLINYRLDGEVRTGIQTKDGIADIIENAVHYNMDVPTTMPKIIKAGRPGLERLAILESYDLTTMSEDMIDYEPCVSDPEKILCVGLNYKAHIEEAKEDFPDKPILFGKYNNALAAHKDNVALPLVTEQMDYEAELVIIIGREAKNVSKKEAMSYVFGYTCGNDFSARDLQFISGQWLIGKNCDRFAPIGPCVVTEDSIDVSSLAIKSKVNGEIRQLSDTSYMIFDCAEIISYASRHMTLKPGDLIFTGTPNGVIMGYPEEERVWLKPGDVVEVTIEGIGTLVNTIV